jgi:hypothetical protein
MNGTLDPYREYVKWLEELQKRFSHNKTVKDFISIYVRRQFSRYSPHVHLNSVLYISIHGTLINRSALSSNCIWRDCSPHYFYVCQTILNHPRIFESVRQTLIRLITDVHWFRWKIFWAFVVNPDFIYNQNSTLITLRTRTVNVFIVSCKIL